MGKSPRRSRSNGMDQLSQMAFVRQVLSLMRRLRTLLLSRVLLYGGERRCGRYLSCPGMQHNEISLGSNLDLAIQSPVCQSPWEGRQGAHCVSQLTLIASNFSLSTKRKNSGNTNNGNLKIRHVRILGIGLELACNGGSCGGNVI